MIGVIITSNFALILWHTGLPQGRYLLAGFIFGYHICCTIIIHHNYSIATTQKNIAPKVPKYSNNYIVHGKTITH